MDFESFSQRHVGPRASQVPEMLRVLGVSSLEELINKTIPQSIRLEDSLSLAQGAAEHEVLDEIKEIASRNTIYRSYIGLGFYDCVIPPVIQRCVLENPGWYTQYTPYQAEISQGRLEALLSFQTMVSDLTGLALANSSLLDEGTAAAEAMTMCYRLKGGRGKKTKFFVSEEVHPPTLEVLKTRAEPLGISLVLGDHEQAQFDEQFFGALIQYPTSDGALFDYRAFCSTAHDAEMLVVAASDLLALALLEPPGEWGADVAIGNSQRFGVPLGFGGPHAAFFATREVFRREMPGRIIGVSKDSSGAPAYRLALQTREQHIRRERATSNICTAQVLLAILAGAYAIYHGPKGVRKIAERVHGLTEGLAALLKSNGIALRHAAFFDTLRTEPLGKELPKVLERAGKHKINFRVFEDDSLGISLDEKATRSEVLEIVEVLSGKKADSAKFELGAKSAAIPQTLRRTSDYLTHPVFSLYHSETEMMRYLHRLQAKDLSLTSSMIPLGSCTMKLNAACEMMPITWPEFTQIHPFVPAEQAEGYKILTEQLEGMLAEITGFVGVSLQPNAGSQGEYSGLLAIRRYHQGRGDLERNVCLIPASAHGTNPASATLAGMKVVVVSCDELGNVSLEDLEAKAKEHQDALAAIMITYPSTHGVFEESIREICDIVHRYGGQVYMDGANLNAQVALCRPGDFGVDVCHLNLHKTFSIPHGGGGPGVGPIAAAKHLVPYLPGHIYGELAKERVSGAVCSAPWGSASILSISWAYIRLMGDEGLRLATQAAILNANYIAKRLEDHFPVLYKGSKGMVAHECILDLRNFKKAIGIEVGDVAKRLMDYGFHAPTVSFPVVETLMVEPTESESKEELDRFCEAMISIREELREVEEGRVDPQNNVLKNAPHTAEMLASDEWKFPYSREKAAYPLAWLRQRKFWPAVGRIDNAYGDRNLFCCCVPVEAQ